MKKFIKGLRSNATLLIMVLPGLLWMIVMFFIPIFGNVVAFKDLKYSGKGFVSSIIQSKWVGFDNFKFLFESNSAYLITRNTVLYSITFIILATLFAVILSVIMSMLRDSRKVKVYQTSLLFPYFLSWVVISFFLYSFLSPDRGAVNGVLNSIGVEGVNWYNEPKYWPYIIVFMGIWKSIGYESILYFATIMGIDPTFYEAAIVDGATRWQQVKYVTLPMIRPIVSIMLILAVGNIFGSDFGLFYNLPRDSGPLLPVTQTIDTYVYRGLSSSGNLGMSSAAGLYQSMVGTVLIVGANIVAKKVDPESGLF